MKLTQIILVLFVMFNAVPSIAAEWVPTGGRDNSQFDKSSIKDAENGNILVWQKYVMTKDLMKTLVKMLKKAKISADLSGYSYSVSLSVMNCKDETSDVMGVTLYDKNGGVIFTPADMYERLQTPELTPVIPDSDGEMILKTICRYVAAHKKGMTPD